MDKLVNIAFVYTYTLLRPIDSVYKSTILFHIRGSTVSYASSKVVTIHQFVCLSVRLYVRLSV